MNTDRAIIKQEPPVLSPALEHLAEQISRSTIIPVEFKGSPANCLIALEMAHRVGAGVLQVMQSLYIVHGKPSWSGQFIIGAVNSSRRFKPLRFEFNKDKSECAALTEDLDGNELRGPLVSIEMAKKEGWWQRNPKWQNLTELMLMYRAGTFFGRVYCSDILMGMREQYEVLEAQAVEIKEPQIPTTTKDIIHEATVGKDAPVTDPLTKHEMEPPKERPAPPAKPELQKKKAVSSIAPDTNSQSTSKRRLKVKAPLTNELMEAAKKVIGAHRKALAERLAIGNFTEAAFLSVANHHEWLGKGKQWASMDDVPDDMFEVFMQPDEWMIVQEQLEKTRTYI